LCTSFQQWPGVSEEFRKCRQGSRRYDVDWSAEVADESLDPFGMDHRRQLRNTNGFAQECGLLAIAFDEMHGNSGNFGQRASDRQPGKAAAGAQIDPDSGVGRQCKQLQRISNVACPYGGDRRRRNEIDFLLPSQKKRNDLIEAFCRFT